MGDPALVLGAHLARAVDAAHAQHRGRQAEGAGVVEHVLVGRALGAAVGRVEVERPVLADAVRADAGVARRVGVALAVQRHVGEVAVDLVGAGEDERHRLAAPAAERLQQREACRARLTAKSSRGSTRLVVTATCAARWKTQPRLGDGAAQLGLRRGCRRRPRRPGAGGAP